MAQTAIAPDIYQTPDIRLYLAPQITLDLIPPIDRLAQCDNLSFRQVPDLCIEVYTSLLQNLNAQATPNTIDVRQADLHSFVPGQVHTRNTRHISYS
jgi:hypothetical protein